MKRKRSHIIFALARIASDIFMINSAFLFSYWLRFHSGFIHTIYGIAPFQSYIKPLPIMTILLLFIMRSFNLYGLQRRLSAIDEFFAVVKSMTAGLVLLMAATFIYREFSYSRVMLLVCAFNIIVFVFLGRFIINRFRILLRRANRDYSNLLIIGTGPTTQRLIKHVGIDPHWNYRIAGLISVAGEIPQKEVSGVPVLGGLNDLPAILSRKDIEEVILTVPSMPREKIMSIIFECEKRMIYFRLIADILGMITSQVNMENIDGIPLLGLKESPLSLAYNRFIKRAVDILGSLAGLILLSPFFILIAIAIKLTSKGPVFYLQKRVGEDGRRFAIFKFRTMVYRAEKGTGAVWAKANDPRRTAIGTFLRSHNLDELPQLINVLKGEMSLVGPRPERPKFVGQFRENIPRYMARHKIKSGITGWAQVNGLRGNTSIEERTKYDLYYVENWSLMFDIKILLMSVFQTLFLKPENAY